MAHVACTKTGFITGRSFYRGYRLAKDSCRVCQSPLRRPTKADMEMWERYATQHLCRSHACYGLEVHLQDTGIYSAHVLSGTSWGLVSSMNHYYDERLWLCPKCQSGEITREHFIDEEAIR